MRSFTILLTLAIPAIMQGISHQPEAVLQNITQQLDSHVKSLGSQNSDQNNDSSGTGRQMQYEIPHPTPLEIMRYRYHHGTNLGSVYVIERWLQPSRFPEGAEGSSELAAVKAWVDKIGLNATQRKYEEYWNTAVTEDDIKWLVEKAKCTTIRLPIGYYDLPGRFFTHGTPFEPYAQVYKTAWDSIRRLIVRLRQHSIGVVIDMHALPGGANNQEHSGTNSGRTELWNSTFNLALGVACFEFIARDSQNGADLVGIQLVNEPEWNAPGMYDWYDRCITAISAADPSLPVIISDGWNLNRSIQYSLGKNNMNAQKPIAPVVIDSHYYWAFTDADKRKPAQEIVSEVPTKLNELNGKEGSVMDRGAVQVIVGEYSCALTPDSWASCPGTSKEECRASFGRAQSKRWQQRAGGSFFWTLKMDWMPGDEWGFVAQTDAGNILPPKHARLSQQDKSARLQKATRERDIRLHSAREAYIAQWRRVDPEGDYNDGTYGYGWKVGYQDAFTFLAGRATQGDKIGMLELWVLKRLKESGYRGALARQFENGLRKGFQDFYAVVEL